MADLRAGAPPPASALVSVQEVRAGDAEPMVRAMGREGDLVASRLARGCRAFAAFRDGWVLGYGWLSPGPEWIGEVRMEITPAPGEAYVWNCVTLSDHRRRGVFEALLRGICRCAWEAAVRRLWIGSVDNPAERVLPKLGFQPALRISALRVGPVRALTTRALGPAAGDALRATSLRAGTTVSLARGRVH